MRTTRHNASSLAMAAMTVAAAACAARSLAAPAPITPSPAAEVVLGERALARFLATHPQSEDGALSLRVSRIGYSVARVSDRPDLIYSFLVIAGPELQAYSFTGGTVCLTEGLARLYASDDELAFAVAHELAHIALRHTPSEAVLEAALAAGAASDPQAARDLYGQTAEIEADRYGALYACRSGFKVSASSEALERLAKASPDRDQDGRHPAYDERIQVLKRLRGELDHAVEAFERGKAALTKAEVGEAVGMFTLFAASFPQSVSGQVNLGAAFLARARSRAGSTGQLEEVVPFLPDPEVAVRGEPPAADLERARERFRKALSLRPDEPEASLGLAVTLLRLADFTGAREQLEQLIARTGRQPEAVLCLGNVEYLTGDPRNASERFREALELKPGWPAATKNLALAEGAAGNKDRARELWESLVADPKLGAQARQYLDSAR